MNRESIESTMQLSTMKQYRCETTIGCLMTTPLWLRNKVSLYWFLCVISLVCFLPIVFTTFAPYDDEAYVMLSIDSVLSGGTLYDEVHTQYGPAFYEWSSLLHGALQLPISHDVVRIKTAILLAMTVCLIAAAVWRATGVRWIASAIGVLSLVLLRTLALEPGHPQELSLLFSAMAIWIVATRLKHRFILAAVLIAFVSLTKVNCGAILIVVFAHLLTNIQLSRKSQSLFNFVWQSARLTGLLLLPAMVAYKSHLGWLSCCSLVGLSAIGFYEFHRSIYKRPSQQRLLTGARLIGFSASLLLTSLAILGIAICAGVSPNGLLHGLIFQHVGFSKTFQHAIEVQPLSLILLVAGIGISVHQCLSKTKKPRDLDARYLFSFAAMLFVGVTLILESHMRLTHGLQPRATDNWLLSISPVIGFWLFQDAKRSREFRQLIGTYCCLSPLIAFPTPGTQLSIGVLPTLIALGILAGDFVRSRRIRVGTSKLYYKILASISVATFLACSAPAILRWSSFQSLGLRGANYLRLPLDEVHEHRDLVRAIDDCRTEFLAFEGHNHCRFYFWTECRPLTYANPTFWPNMLSDEEGEKWRQELIKHADSVCYVVPPESEVLSGNKFQGLRAEFVALTRPSASVGQWLVRKPSKMPKNVYRKLISSPEHDLGK